MTLPLLDQIDIQDIIVIAQEAGDAILAVYNQDFNVEHKTDNSPLTKADKAAHNVIIKGLEALDIQLPVLSEEGSKIPYDTRKDWDAYWLVDPLDGTKEFIKKNGEFTVNIALIHQGKPVLGVVYAPAKKLLYYGQTGKGAFKNGASIPLKENQNRDNYIVVASRSHMSEETEKFIEEIKTDKPITTLSKGSSLKLCLVAEGAADVYPRLAPTMEWDTGAADAVARAAGLAVVDYHTQKPLAYNKENLLNPWFVVGLK